VIRSGIITAPTMCDCCGKVKELLVEFDPGDPKPVVRHCSECMNEALAKFMSWLVDELGGVRADVDKLKAKKE
jgi:hypothetical protein